MTFKVVEVSAFLVHLYGHLFTEEPLLKLLQLVDLLVRQRILEMQWRFHMHPERLESEPALDLRLDVLLGLRQNSV